MPELELTIGSDPEYMIFDETRNRIASALYFLPNGKEEKVDLGDDFRCYSDNTQFEAEIPPSDTTEGTVNAFTNLVTKATNLLKERGVRLIAQASHNFPDEDLEHPAARMAGCSVEYCANTISIPDRIDLSNESLRTAGVHLHLGRKDWKTCPDDSAFLLTPYSKIAMIRTLDYNLGTTFTYLEKDPTAMARKRLYGKAGRHRVTVYGAEYRTLSPLWSTRPELVSFVDRLTRYSAKLCEQDYEKWLDKSYDFHEVADIIDSGDSDKAKQFIEKNLPGEFVREAKKLNKIPFNPRLDECYGLV